MASNGDQLIAPLPAFDVPTWTKPFAFLASTIKGWNFLLFFVLVTISITFVAATPAGFYEMCEGDRFIDDERTLSCLRNNSIAIGFVEGLAGLFILLTFMVLGAGFAWSGHRRRGRRLRRAYETRIQGIRDRVMAGTAPPESFDEVQRIWKPLVRGDHPAARARAGSSAAIIANVFNSLTLVIGLTTYVIGISAMGAEEQGTELDIFVVMWNAIIIPILLVLAVAVVYWWIKAPRTHSLSSHATEEAIDAAERVEMRVVADPNAPRRTRTAVAAGPSFSPYSGRSGQ